MNSKRDLQQSVKLVGELHKNADWHTFHDVTFTLSAGKVRNECWMR